MKSLKDLAAELDEAKEIVAGEDQTEQVEASDGTQEAYDILANAVAVAMSQIENTLGMEWQSAGEATKFAQKLLKGLAGPGRSHLAKRLAKYERQGADRTISVARRTLAQ